MAAIIVLIFYGPFVVVASWREIGQFSECLRMSKNMFTRARKSLKTWGSFVFGGGVSVRI